MSGISAMTFDLMLPVCMNYTPEMSVVKFDVIFEASLGDSKLRKGSSVYGFVLRLCYVCCRGSRVMSISVSRVLSEI